MTPPEPPRPALTVVRRGSGEVVLGTLPAAPAGVVTVPLPSATAYVDPTAPESLPAVVVGDEMEAADALDALFGTEVARRAFAATEPGELVPALRTEAVDRLVRYALRAWLWSTGTLPVDRRTLGVERALAADGVEDLLDPDAEEVPGVADLAPVAVALARTLARAGDDEAWPGLAGLVDDLLATVRGQLTVDDPMAEPVTHEAEVRAALERFGAASLDWDRWAALLETARPPTAIHAGPDSSAWPAEGVTGLDWAFVPAGVLDRGEDAVRWRTSAGRDGEVRVSVAVRADPWPTASAGLARLVSEEPGATAALARLSGLEPAPELRFRLYVPGFSLPVADGALARTPDGRSWRGEAEVPARMMAPGPVQVLVHGAGRRARPRSRVQRTAAEAMRWAARGLSLLRVSLVAGSDPREGLRTGVREPWERARELYASVAETDSPEAGLALRQQARCAAVVLAYVEATGETRTRRLRAELAALEPHVEPGDVAVPDLADRAWAATVAEAGLLARGRG